MAAEALAVLAGPFSAHPGRAPGRGRCGFQRGPSHSCAPAGGRLAPEGTPSPTCPHRGVDGDGLGTESDRPTTSTCGTRGPESAAERVARHAGPAAEEIVTALLRHTRSLLTLKGRPPLRLAGLETYERLDHVARVRRALVAERYAPRLVQLYQGLQSALSPCAALAQALQQGAAWLRDIAYL